MERRPTDARPSARAMIELAEAESSARLARVLGVRHFSSAHKICPILDLTLTGRKHLPR